MSEKLKNQSIDFWNEQFSKLKAEKLNTEDFKVENSLDQALKEIGDECERVLDIASGSGYALFKAFILGSKMNYGIGLDSSVNAINFCKDSAKFSNIKNLHFIWGDESYLEQIESDSFDGIICSNFLDVVDESVSKKVISEIKRILKPQGKLLLKLNFHLTDEWIEKLKMTEVKEKTFEMNGVIRAYNLSSEEWIERLAPLSLIKTDEFLRHESLPMDRIFVFQK